MADNPAYANYSYQDVHDRLQSIDLGSVATAQNLWDSVFQGFTNLAADLRKQRDQLKTVWTGPGSDTYGQQLENLATELDNIAKQAKDPTYRSFWQSFASVKDVVKAALSAYDGKFKEVPSKPPPQMSKIEASNYRDGGGGPDEYKFGGDDAGVRAIFTKLARDYRDIKDGLPNPPAPAQGPAGPADGQPSSPLRMEGKDTFGGTPADLPIAPADAFGKLPDGAVPPGAGIDPRSMPISPVGPIGGVDVPGGPGADVPGMGMPGIDVSGGPGIAVPGVDIPGAPGVTVPASGVDPKLPGYTGIDPSTGLPFGLDPSTKLADFQPASGTGLGGGSSAFGGPDGLGPLGGAGAAGALGALGAGPGGASSGAITPRDAAGANGGANGAAGMGYPGGMGGMGHGAGKDGEERQRQSWIPEDQDIWGADTSAPPPVIGRG
ncbi:hypothetical protein ABH920_006548 [Catenulispora sp. EB89]|uniref:WXG100 family type VII secretion target n=1 Tax=Catenulispora sp. EB89 TaxID=3156257 RepID=UPI003514D04E